MILIGLPFLNETETEKTWAVDMKNYPMTAGMMVGTILTNWMVVPAVTHHDYLLGCMTGLVAAFLILLIMPLIEQKLR